MSRNGSGARKICKVAGCDREANIPGAARGYCASHYRRVLKAEADGRNPGLSPDETPLQRARREVEEQIPYDAARGAARSVLDARWHALLSAELALSANEIGARDGLRGALIDLASAGIVAVAELDAADRGAAEALEPAIAA